MVAPGTIPPTELVINLGVMNVAELPTKVDQVNLPRWQDITYNWAGSKFEGERRVWSMGLKVLEGVLGSASNWKP